jgi:hypothetical protein
MQYLNNDKLVLYEHLLFLVLSPNVFWLRLTVSVFHFYYTLRMQSNGSNISNLELQIRPDLKCYFLTTKISFVTRSKSEV